MLETLRSYWSIISTIITVVAVPAVGYLYKKYKQADARQKAVELGVQALLRDRIVQSYYHYEERGWITLHGLENVNAMYKEYHALGGNGTVTALVNTIHELEVRDDKRPRLSGLSWRGGRMEFSKKMLVLHICISVLLCITTIVGTLTDHDVTAIAALTGTSFVTDGAWGGFYYWKSKNENRAKYAQRFLNKFADKYGADAALRAAEIVLKD